MSRIDEALRRASLGVSPVAEGPQEATEKRLPPLVGLEPAIVESARVQAEYVPEEVCAPSAFAGESRVVGESGVPGGVSSDAARPDETNAPQSDADSALLQQVSAGVNAKLVVSSTVEPLAIEQYRRLAVTLHQMQVERGTRIVLVSSAIAGEGKTLTSANLALTLSESLRRQVLLIDADMRRPSLHNIFQIPNVGGLGDGLSARGDEKLTLIKVSEYLTVLPAGRPDPNPMGGLTSERMRRILEEASAKFDWVILDTPPVGVITDANILAEMADTVVFVIGAGTTPFKPIQRAVTALGRQRIAGVVLNRVQTAESTYQYYARDYYARSDVSPSPTL